MSKAHSSLSLHGVMMMIENKGVLIAGRPGVGKSSLALELINNGYKLIADDVIDFSINNHQLIASSPSLLKGLLHTRELGLLDIKILFGDTALQSCHQLDLIVELTESASFTHQLESQHKTKEISGVTIPVLTLTTQNPASLALRLTMWLKNYELQSETILKFKRQQQQAMQQ